MLNLADHATSLLKEYEKLWRGAATIYWDNESLGQFRAHASIVTDADMDWNPVFKANIRSVSGGGCLEKSRWISRSFSDTLVNLALLSQVNRSATVDTSRRHLFDCVHHCATDS